VSAPIWTVDAVPVFAAEDDLPTTDQEHGNLSVTVEPPALWIWFEPTGWQAITVAATDLEPRVARVEQRLACLAECLAEP
jgi:hypothetical protein